LTAPRAPPSKLGLANASNSSFSWHRGCAASVGDLCQPRYQQAAIEEMERRAFSVQAMSVARGGADIKMGTVKFPRHGCEQLLTQLLGFGVEKHDDAVDALVCLILGIAPQEVHYI
jgi:hypothetical protein